MKTVLLFVEHKREKLVLDVLLKSYGYTVVVLKFTSKAYMKLLQYKPVAVFVEMLDSFSQQVNIIRALKSNIKTKTIPICAFGSLSGPIEMKYLKDAGVDVYLKRPLRTADIQNILPSLHSGTLTSFKKEQRVLEEELEESSKLLDPATSAIERINIMVKKVAELLAFPFTVAKVLSVTQSESSGAKELAKAIEIDPVVVSSVLKVSNSALYGRAGTSVTSIKDAIVRLGFTETKNIAVSLSVLTLFSDEENSVGFSREDFWFHSLATAVIAGKIAQNAGVKKPELAFVSALLHDFGIILLDEFFPSFLQSSLHATMQKGCSFLDEQKKRWGMTYNDVVVKLFDDWNMPEEVKEIVKHYSHYETYSNEANPEIEKLVAIVGVAEIMAKGLNLGRECDEFIKPVSNEVMATLKQPMPIHKSFFERTFAELNMFATYLNLKKRFHYELDLKENEISYKAVVVQSQEQTVSPYIYCLIASNVLFEVVQSVEEISECSFVPDVAILLTGEEDLTLDEVLAIEVEQEQTSEAEKELVDAGLETAYLPVVIIGDEFESELLPDHATQLSREVDLRIFSYITESLVLGNKVTLDTIVNTDDSSLFDEKILHEKTTDQIFKYKTSLVGNEGVLISLKGAVKRVNFPSIKNVLSLALNKSRNIAVDFSGVTILDKKVVQSLLQIQMSLRTKGIVLHLCAIEDSLSMKHAEIYQRVMPYYNNEYDLKAFFIEQREKNLTV